MKLKTGKDSENEKIEETINDNATGILSSLVFLKGEVKKVHLAQTEKAIDEAIEAFFLDMKKAHKLDENLEIIRNFLQRLLSLDKEELDNFIRLIQFFDAAGDNEVAN